MKKHKTWMTPQMIPNRKKAMERLAANPDAVKAIIEMNKAATAVLEKQRTQKALTVDEWLERSLAILPEKFDTDEFKERIRLAVTTDEALNDTHNERKDC